MEVKPLFSLLAAKAAIVNQLHGLSVCFASFNMVTPLREHFLMFPRFGNALDILSEYCEERYEEALAAYRQASECSASEPSSYEKQAQVLEKWASKLRKRAMGSPKGEEHIRKLLCRNRLRGLSWKGTSQSRLFATASKQPACPQSGHEPNL